MFLAMLRQHIFYVEWVQFRKMREFFRAKLCCKMTDLFCYYLWLWDFLPENLKLVDKLQLWRFSLFIFWYKFRFLRSAKNLFNFKIFRCRPTMVAYILTQPSPPTVKKLPTALNIRYGWIFWRKFIIIMIFFL